MKHERPIPDLPRAVAATLAALAAAALLVTVLVHLRAAGQRFIDTDELEHLNAACFVARGETLYGSVFENHPPLTVALLQPVVRSSDDPGTLLMRGRLLSVAAALATLFVVARLGRGLAGWPGAALAPLLLSCHTFFAERSIEVRPDVHAMLLSTLALAALIGGLARGDARRLCLGGALFALAGFFTPKVVYAAAGATLGAVFASRGPGGSRLRARAGTLAWIGLGAGLVTAVAILEMARRGMLAGFVQDCLVVSTRMTIDDPAAFRRNLLGRTLRENPAHWILGLAGLAVFLRVQGKGLRPAGAVLGFGLIAGFAGLFHIQAPLRQYYLSFLPPLALAAAIGLVALLGQVGRSLGAAASWSALFLGLGACLFPPGSHLLRKQVSKDMQLAVIEKVREITGERDRVLDCWSGLYLTRLPAYRYFYLNSDLLRLLDPTVLERELHACLDDPAVKVVITGRHYRLPASVRDRVEQEFLPVKRFPILRLRPAAQPREER